MVLNDGMSLFISKMEMKPLRTTVLKSPNLSLCLPSPPRARLCTLLLVLQSSLPLVFLHSARMSLFLGHFRRQEMCFKEKP